MKSPRLLSQAPLRRASFPQNEGRFIGREFELALSGRVREARQSSTVEVSRMLNACFYLPTSMLWLVATRYSSAEEVSINARRRWRNDNSAVPAWGSQWQRCRDCV